MAFSPQVSTEQVMMAVDNIEMVDNRYTSSPFWEKNFSDAVVTKRESNLIYLSDIMPSVLHSSSSEKIVFDNFRRERRQLYSLIEEYSLENDETRPIVFFDKLLEENDKAMCFEQIKIIFQTAYSKGLMKMANNVLLLLLNYDSDEVGETGVAIASMALQNKDNHEMQSLSLSLINKWKSKGFERVIRTYQVPENDVFLKMKYKKSLAIFG